MRVGSVINTKASLKGGTGTPNSLLCLVPMITPVPDQVALIGDASLRGIPGPCFSLNVTAAVGGVQATVLLVARAGDNATHPLLAGVVGGLGQILQRDVLIMSTPRCEEVIS